MLSWYVLSLQQHACKHVLPHPKGHLRAKQCCTRATAKGTSVWHGKQLLIATTDSIQLAAAATSLQPILRPLLGRIGLSARPIQPSFPSNKKSLPEFTPPLALAMGPSLMHATTPHIYFTPPYCALPQVSPNTMSAFVHQTVCSNVVMVLVNAVSLCAPDSVLKCCDIPFRCCQPLCTRVCA